MTLRKVLLIGLVGLGALSLAGFTYSHWGMGVPSGCYMWGGEAPTGVVSTPQEAKRAVEAYLAESPGLVVTEVMEFSNHFYVRMVEEATGIGVMELLVWRDGRVMPEPGPNMMWNQRYSHRGLIGPGMMSAPSQDTETPVEMPISPERARELAREYLAQSMADAEVGEAAPFYGYYTLHVLREGQVVGMVSVNGYSGAVWYHAWHGEFLGMEGDEHGE